MLIAPLMPGINDAPRQIEPLLEAASAAGATSIGGVALHLRGEVREVFMCWLEAKRPDLVARYERLYSRGAYAPRRERERLAGLVRWTGSPGGFRSVEPAAEPVDSDGERAPGDARAEPQGSLF